MNNTIETIQPKKDSKMWRYQITWFTKNPNQSLDESIGKCIVESLYKQCDELAGHLENIEVNSNTVQFNLIIKSQINISKTIRGMQKKLAKDLVKAFPQHNHYLANLWSDKELVVTDSVSTGEFEKRIEKVLDNLEEVAYYDLDECLDDDNIESLVRYLEQRSLGVIEWGEQMFLVDKKAIQQEINLNCFECTKQYKFGCCSGNPCDSSPQNIRNMQRHLADIQKEMKAIDLQHYQEVIGAGGIIEGNCSIKAYNERCSLLVEHEGIHKCMAHKYALDHQIPIYEICPLSCLMYPLEIIELITDKFKKVTLLTSVVDQSFAKEFGRWGSYQSLETELKCLDKGAHNEFFRESDYQPVYKVNKKLLVHEFGPIIYDGIKQLIEK